MANLEHEIRKLRRDLECHKEGIDADMVNLVARVETLEEKWKNGWGKLIANVVPWILTIVFIGAFIVFLYYLSVHIEKAVQKENIPSSCAEQERLGNIPKDDDAR